MAKCIYCERELPGLEKVCSACLESSYDHLAAKPQYRKVLASVIIAGCVVAVVLFVPQVLKIFNMSTLLVKFLLATGAVSWGIWESLRYHSWRTLFFWVIYTPFLITFAFWLLTSKMLWAFALLGCCGLIILSRKFQAYSSQF